MFAALNHPSTRTLRHLYRSALGQLQVLSLFGNALPAHKKYRNAMHAFLTTMPYTHGC